MIPAPRAPRPALDLRVVIVLGAITAGVFLWWRPWNWSPPRSLTLPAALDFGVVPVGKNIASDLRLSNHSSTSVQCIGVRRSCSCIQTPAVPFNIPANADFAMPLTINTADLPAGKAAELQLTLFFDAADTAAATVPISFSMARATGSSSAKAP